MLALASDRFSATHHLRDSAWKRTIYSMLFYLFNIARLLNFLLNLEHNSMFFFHSHEQQKRRMYNKWIFHSCTSQAFGCKGETISCLRNWHICRQEILWLLVLSAESWAAMLRGYLRYILHYTYIFEFYTYTFFLHGGRIKVKFFPTVTCDSLSQAATNIYISRYYYYY